MAGYAARSSGMPVIKLCRGLWQPELLPQEARQPLGQSAVAANPALKHLLTVGAEKAIRMRARSGRCR